MQQASFNIYAEDYDNHFTNSLVGKAQRDAVHCYLETKVSLKGDVLEMNCGTGEDALFFLKSCNSIVCTDISEGMISVAANKISEFRNSKAIVSCIQEIAEIVQGKYDLLFSNFGGLNCLNKKEFECFAESSERLTKEKSSDLVFVIMGTKCWWEAFYFLMKGRKKDAFRRLDKSGAVADLGNATQLTFYYSPKEIRTMFSANYEVVTTRPIGFFVPPSYLNPFVERHKILFSIFRKLDKVISGFGFLSNYSDHYLIHLKRK